MNKRIITLIGLLACTQVICAQIGYQVSLLNSATGEPRANESVTVKIEITNSENTVICTEEKNATSNEFGVLSLSVGNEKTFEDVDWTKAPFYVSATVDDALIGKSQILTVPIAEAAKRIVGVSREVLEGIWKYTSGDIWAKLNFTFKDNYSGTVIKSRSKWVNNGVPFTHTYTFTITGNIIWLLQEPNGGYDNILLYHDGKLHDVDETYIKQ
jgi:hypothetical protein